jgi:hypothetical protein
MWLVFFSGLLSGLLILVLLGRFNERAIARNWEVLASSQVEAACRQKREELDDEIQIADVAYEQALALQEVGSVDEALDLLDAGYQAIEAFAPNLLRFLSGMGVWSRMVSAMAPVAPLRPPDFRLAQLSNLAYLNQLVHHFSVTTKERFRLRLHILSRAVHILVRFLLHTTQRIRRNNERDIVEREWRQIDAIRQDLRTVVDKSLESYKVLLASVLAERRVIEVTWTSED